MALKLSGKPKSDSSNKIVVALPPLPKLVKLNPPNFVKKCQVTCR